MLFSPGICLLTGCITLAFSETPEDAIVVLFLLGVEAVSRGFMFFGAFQTGSNAKGGVGLMWFGGWSLMILMMLKFLLMTLGVLALLSAESANNAPPPEATPDGTSIGGLIILVTYFGELLYLMFMLAGLADFRRRNR